MIQSALTHWPRLARWADKLRVHGDFLLLLILSVAFRLSAVLFFRPGGYTRDYTDLIYYLRRASWQEYGLWPYRDYWSEYPPLFAWFSVWIDTLSRRIPLWEDDRLWYAAFFGLSMAVAETITLCCLYSLARRLYPKQALRVVWLYTALFLPVYFLSGWFDALPVATIWLALLLLVYWPTLTGLLLLGLVVGIGGLLKLVPLVMLALLPLATPRRWHWLLSGAVALTVLLGGYALAYSNGPVMTLTSIRSLAERSGWSTLYAWVNNYTRLGKVLGDPFDPAANMTLYTSWYPQGLVWAFWLVCGGLILWALWRQHPAPQPAQQLVGFAAITYAILLLAYPAWNPQYALYLLPLLILRWPTARGVGYALVLSLIVLLEHPIYHNLLGPDYAPVHRRLIAFDYRQLFLAIIVARTVVLVALTGDLALQLLQDKPRWRSVPVLLTGAAVVGLLALTPRFAAAYTAGRLATSPVRPLALFLNTQPQLTIVTQDFALSRQLRPFLSNAERLTLIGGPTGEPSARLPTASPLIYVRTAQDDAALADQLAQRYGCAPAARLEPWDLWLCQSAQLQPVADFAQGIQLVTATVPKRLTDTLHLTLFWQTDQAITQDYTVFVHVLDATGAMIGQWDQPPAGGEAPTTTWQPQRLVVDDYQVPITLAQAIAPYRVYVGLYDPQNGQRLPIRASARLVTDNRLELHLFAQ